MPPSRTHPVSSRGCKEASEMLRRRGNKGSGAMPTMEVTKPDNHFACLAELVQAIESGARVLLSGDRPKFRGICGLPAQAKCRVDGDAAQDKSATRQHQRARRFPEEQPNP